MRAQALKYGTFGFPSKEGKKVVENKKETKYTVSYVALYRRNLTVTPTKIVFNLI